MSEIFLDTETTGLSFKDGHKIVEIACVETKDLIPTGNVFHRLINPKRNVPEEAFKVHGFSEEFLKDKETFDKIVYLMNIENSKFRKPVFPNEKIKANVVAIRSKGRVWRFEGNSFNEKEELVCSSTWSAMIMDRNNE